MIQNKKINVFLLCIVAFLMPQESLSVGSKTQTDKAIILFEHEQDYQFDIFMEWLTKVRLLTEADAIRKEFTKPLPFDADKIDKDFGNLVTKEIIARKDKHKTNVPDECFFGRALDDVTVLIDKSNKIRSCSSTCSDNELIERHLYFNRHATFFEDFIKECKNKMWDVEELRRIPYPSKEHP